MPTPRRFAATAVFFVAIMLVVRWDRRRTGMFINGYRPGRTLWVTPPMLAAALAPYGIGSWLASEHHAVAIPLTLAAVATAVGCGGSVLWCSVFRRELTGERA